MSVEQASAPVDPLLRDFVVESMENLAEVQSRLLAIEQAGDAADNELLNDVFRRVHTVKGIAGFLALERILELAHALENVLSLMRDRKLSPSAETIEALLQGSDLLQRMVQDVERSNQYDCSAQIESLKHIAEGRHGAEGKKPTPVEQSLAKVECAVAKLAEETTSEPIKQAAEAPIAVPAEPAKTELTKAPAKGAAPSAPAAGGEAGGNATIRVAVSVLENLVNLAGEMVLARNQLLRAIHGKRQSGLNAAGTKLDQVTTAMQDAIMGARMQPVGTVFGRFPRMLRELARKLQKQCRLTVEGDDVELDRTILEAIVDPLTHLIRNSVDHGLETPRVREENGKAAEGELRLCAFRRAGKVHITLSDDGRGIDRKRVLEKAISQGLVPAQEAGAMSDRDVYQLIFRPGFSTAEQVSEVSGRGVGMDVVKSHIEKVGGTVGVESTPGQGTTVHISLPLTLAILPAWIVHQGSYRIAVPESAIVELIRLNTGEEGSRIERVDNAPVLRRRGQLLPLIRLDELLPCPVGETPVKRQADNVIVLETGFLRYGLVVEHMNDPEQIVVKPLGKHFAGCPYIDGAAVLGDGRVTYVLDVAGAAMHSGLSGRSLEPLVNAEETSTVRETQTALLFRTADGRMAAISRMMIQRIERMDAAQIRPMHGTYAVGYENRMMPLVKLRDDMPAPSGCGYVLVFQAMADEIGIWASELVDIREVPTTVDARLRSTPGSLGTVVVDGEPVELLDVFELADGMNDPHAKTPAKGHDDGGALMTILLVEDVQFFRQQVSRFLRRAGYRIVMAENGAKALSLLQEQQESVQIVLTDIEMPVMNGIELCRKIKGDASLSHLPVIALTALNGEGDMRRGREAGFNDWQVKLDRDRLLGAIRAIVRDANLCED